MGKRLLEKYMQCENVDWICLVQVVEKTGSQVDGTGSGSCPVAGCSTSSVEPSGYATRELVLFLCSSVVLLYNHLGS
jgi:hypothetical protein